MDLSKKKELAKRTFKVGKERIVFVEARLEDIKEAIRKQDMRDLYNEGAILIKDIKGRRKIQKRKKKKGPGKIRKKVNKRKKEYVIMTRKLRKYLVSVKKQEKVSKENVDDIRKKIRNKVFKSKAQLKNYIGKLKE